MTVRKQVANILQPLAINEYMNFDTLSFPDILRENLLDSNEKYASDDADFIFISIPLGEAIELLFDEIYFQK